MGGASSSAKNPSRQHKDKKGRREGSQESGEDRKTRPVVPRLDLTYAVSLAQGHRPYQEDRTAVAHPCPCPERKEDRSVSFFAVYDGHAGTWTADYLVNNLHHLIARQKEYAGPNKLDAISRGFQECDAQILEEGGKARDGSGATAVVAIVDGETVFVGNCGDSRAVICRSERRAPTAAGNPKVQLQLPVPVPVPGVVPSAESERERERERGSGSGSGSDAPGEVEVLTVDHKPTDEPETQRIHAAGGLVHNKYIELHGRGLAVSRALGDAYFKSQPGRSPLEQAVTAVPHLKAVPRSRYDQFLLLASDGLWNVMTEKEACAFVMAERKRLRDEATDFGRKASSATDKEILEEVAAALTQRALDLKSKDNIACLIVEFRHSPSHGGRTLPKDA